MIEIDYTPPEIPNFAPMNSTLPEKEWDSVRLMQERLFEREAEHRLVDYFVLIGRGDLIDIPVSDQVQTLDFEQTYILVA